MKQILGRDGHKWLDGQMGGYQKWWEFDLNFILINSCNSRWNEILKMKVTERGESDESQINVGLRWFEHLNIGSLNWAGECAAAVDS